MAAQILHDHVTGLAKELECSICLSVMGVPVARLPCCHYFCQGCITESIRHSPACPVCKARATRRDIAADPTMDRVVAAFKGMHDQQGALAAAAEDDGCNAIPWLQGVDDAAFKSPSKSLSGTAIERLRGKRAGSASPATVTRKQRPARNTEEGGVEAAAAAKPAAVKPQEEKMGAGKKRRETGGSQSIHKWLKKGGSSKAAAPTPTAAEEAENEVVVEVEPVSAAAPAEPASPTHWASPMDALIGTEDATKRLDDIVAGLVAYSLPTGGDAPAAAFMRSPGKENAVAATRRNPDLPAAAETAGEEKKGERVSRSSAAAVATAAAVAAALVEEDAEERKEEAAAAAGGRSDRRRIPTRLLPWGCSLCTFENKGSDGACRMCGTHKGAEEAPAAAVAAAAAAEIAASGGKGKGAAGKKKEPPAAAAVSRRSSGRDRDRRRQGKLTGGKPKARAAAAAAAVAPKAEKREEPTTAAAAAAAAAENINQEKAEAGGWSGGRTAWVLLGSALDAGGREELRTLASLSGATVAETWGPKVTHVICGTPKSEGSTSATSPPAKRTFKYLMGMLGGRQVLTAGWVAACLAAGRAVEAAPFQVRPGVDQDGAGASLLRGYEVMLHGDFINRGRMMELLKAAGAVVVTRLPTQGASVKGSTAAPGGVVLLEAPDGSPAAAGFAAAVAAEPWFAKAQAAGVPVVSHRWVSDSVAGLEVCALGEYVIGGK